MVRLVSVGNVLTSASVENLGGEAQSSTVGFSRGGGNFFDDDED